MLDKFESVDPEVGQIYEVRDEVYQILYFDEQVVVLRCDNGGRNGRNKHRIERRNEFDSQVESEWFEYKPDAEIDLTGASKLDWSEVSSIGEKTSENLHQAGFKTAPDVLEGTDEQLLDVTGVGQKGAANLKQFVQ